MKRLILFAALLTAPVSFAGEYKGSYAIDDFVTFELSTRSPTTGAQADADALPTIRIYEEETVAPIHTNTLALFDDTNTTGAYIIRVQATAALGFEAGKSYRARITATVNGITDSTWHHFQIESAVRSNLVRVNNHPTVDGRTWAQIFAIIGAVSGGNITNSATTPTIKSLDGDVDRITSTVDQDGNRTNTIDVSDVP